MLSVSSQKSDLYCKFTEHVKVASTTKTGKTQKPQTMNASQLVAFVSVEENIQRANNVIIVYLERLAFVSVKENIQRVKNVIIVY